LAEQNAWLLRVDPDSGEVRWRLGLSDRDVTVYRARVVDPCVFASLPGCMAPADAGVTGARW
jgi:hypothetical protein